MPLPAVTAPAGAGSLSGRAEAGSRTRMAAAQAAAHKARLVELLRARRWQDALEFLSYAEISGSGLLKANLEGIDLSGADLTGAILPGVNLAGANLSYAILRGADLVRVNLSRANLASANLSGAYLSAANLTDANLAGAWLSGAEIIDGNLTNASLAGANIGGASIPDGFLVSGVRVDAVPWVGTPAGWRAIASPRGARFFPLSEA